VVKVYLFPLLLGLMRPVVSTVHFSKTLEGVSVMVNGILV
jgi:hypothetical protein